MKCGDVSTAMFGDVSNSKVDRNRLRGLFVKMKPCKIWARFDL